ncbi:DUF2835 family protein [Bowmanella dokdonensis]|uniref:DUF2835 family protein n=1 Tax=Bowmanella dokdonensis TaxID=751969 RepID=A0A939DLA4_9ALTE|nr:DUF2835 family protein [Bowmanella dokdonensis]MBN7824382.1 DUF2835 family protein [Bowmanella dokdonensis]
MKVYFFKIEVSYERCRAMYDGSSPYAIIHAESGERVQLPVSNLKPFVGLQGIKGRFRLITDESNKIRSFERVG